MKSTVLYFALVFVLFLRSTNDPQNKIHSYENYIKQYCDLAIQQQKKYHIPASITLAQGLLESGAGQSELARKSNNHFGIKCHSEWKGEKVYYNDDFSNECFRKYKNVESSYEDHSAFLTGRIRYADLFKLDIKDYKGWAKGLQKAGYATNPAYANTLIKLIEDYQLYPYDSGGKAINKEKEEKIMTKIIRILPSFRKSPTPFVIKRSVYEEHGLRYVYAEKDDNLEQLAEDTGLTINDLRKYNEVPEDFPLQKGDLIYLEKKKTKADKPNYDHVVQIGESMHSISQKYGIQLRRLYKINKKKNDYIPTEGDVLKLR
ncbi:MAG: glucosaminidase domain-containing protein [Tannerellaceae bacterium]|jgi:LysM repeat protein|nr:glucosaminidase domain-containing protein [Tannerellaceae bacterium]